MSNNDEHDYFPDDYTVTNGDLDRVAAAVEEADDLYQKYAYLAVPKMPCMECGGTGSIGGGSLSGICPGCMGARVQDMPGAEAPDIPDFRSVRRALKDFAVAHQKGLPPPPSSTLMTPEAIMRTKQEIIGASRQLAAGGGPNGGLLAQLPEAKPYAAGTLGDKDAEYTDAEIDECIDEDTRK